MSRDDRAGAGAHQPLPAHAKLTVSLRLTGVRDDGYHLIDAEMVSLDLHDVLEIEALPTDDIERGPGPAINVTGPFAEGVPTDGDNLVARSLVLLDRRAQVRIDKRIPHGGGLGGGSTDAAAVLRWGGWGTTASDLDEASQLGADIPFCIVGGRARVRGIGEIVDPLPHEDREFTLIIPPLSVSTPAAYREWDLLGGPTAEGPNDLEPAALVVEPRLRWWRDAIAERVGTAPTLAGSGATWFVDGRRDNALADLIDEGAHVEVTRTVPASPAGG